MATGDCTSPHATGLGEAEAHVPRPEEEAVDAGDLSDEGYYNFRLPSTVIHKDSRCNQSGARAKTASLSPRDLADILEVM